MQSQASTIKQYLAELPEERRTALEAVRKVILKSLDKDFEEGMQYGMIGYYVPHRIYPPGYHCDPKQPLCFAGLASQKNYMSIYLMCVYGSESEAKWFRTEWARTGKKLDMGKCCIRFRKLEDLPLEVIGEAIRRMPAKKYIAYCESALKTSNKRAASKSAQGRKTKPATKSATSKSARKGIRGKK